MDTNNVIGSQVGVLGSGANNNTVVFNEGDNNNTQLHNELMQLSELMGKLPKSDSLTNELEKVEQAAEAIKNNDTSKFKKIIGSLASWTLELVKGLGLKLIPEWLS